MRAGVVLSTAIHVGLMALALFGLPQPEAYQLEQPEAFDVEVVPFAEVPTTRLGTREAEELAEQASVIETEQRENTEGLFQGDASRDLNETPTEDPTNLDVEQTAAAAPEPPVVEPEPAPQPESVPEPPVEPAAVEPELAPEAEPAPAEPEQSEPQPTEAAPVPRTRPREIAVAAAAFEQRQREAEANANPDAISQAINRQQESGGGTQASSQAPTLGSTRGQQNVSLTQSEEDSLRQQISRCWSPPVGIAGAETLRVTLRFALNQDGSVASNPQIANSGGGGNPAAFRAAAGAAQRAVLRCAPYSMPAEKYDAWRDVIVNFDPRDML